LRRVTAWKQLVQDYHPVAGSLEWQLSRLSWDREGIQPFAEGSVPFMLNNNGRLSADAAAVLFADCEDSAPDRPSNVWNTRRQPAKGIPAFRLRFTRATIAGTPSCVVTLP
jgi:hypothetical protein